MRLGARLAIGIVLLAGCRARIPEDMPTPRKLLEQQAFNEPIRAAAATSPASQKLANLGEKIFRDVRLSADGTVSCASCHKLEHGGADNVALSTGVHGRHPSVNTPSIFNVTPRRSYGWYGVVPTLEDEIDIDLSAEDRMGNPAEAAAERLRAIPEYAAAFADAAPGFAPAPAVRAALCAYVETLTSVDSAVDKYVETPPQNESDREAVIPWRDGGLGYVLFKQYGCPSCHQGENVGGNLLQTVSLTDAYATYPELGIAEERDTDPLRFIATHLPEDRHVVRVPSLRNVAVTAPYFHDGSVATLEDAIRAESVNQLGHPINDSQVEDIAAFLRKLTGNFRGKPL